MNAVRAIASIAVFLFVSTLGCAPAPPLTTRAPEPKSAIPELSAMTLEEKVGQLFVIGGSATFMNRDSETFRELRHEVVDNHVGGIIWFRSNVSDTALLNGELDRLARIPLLFSADLEPGLGMRYDEVLHGPWAMGTAATGDENLAERRAQATAEEARVLGIAQIYGPVSDVNIDPDNPVINVRSYGEDPKEVARFVAADVRGFQAGGVLATLKHFPGHGDTAVDSHRSLPVLRVDRARLDSVELVPFRAGLAAGAGSVMVAHLSVPALDPAPIPPRSADAALNADSPPAGGAGPHPSLPATVSGPIVTGLLREELGFAGLIVSDALDMGAMVANFAPGEVAVQAFLAGVDQLLNPHDPDVPIHAMIEAVRSGRISMDRLDRSVTRILDAKRRLGLTKPFVPDLSEIARVIDSPAHQALLSEIARRSLTLVREEEGVLPFDPGLRILSVVVNDQPSFAEPGALFSAELARRTSGPGRIPAVTLRLDPRSTPVDVARIIEASRDADIVLVAFHVRARSGAGAITIPEPARDAIPALIEMKKRIVGISFGNPYLLRDFPGIGTYICTYGNLDVVQLAMARALFGEAAFEGHLPVTIPGVATRGTGILKAARKNPG